MRLGLRGATVVAVVTVVLGVLTVTEAAAAPVRAAHAAQSARIRPPSGIVAAAAELINAQTGQPLWSRAMRAKRPIASLTKVMTAIVVIRAGHLSRKIRVSAAAVRYAQEHFAGSAGLHAGDTLTTTQLLEGMLLPSGADAAYTLAQAYGPGWRAFVRKMNNQAKRIGLTQTHFANFDGLPWPTEFSTYSSARDLIKMGEYAMRLPTLRRIVGQRHYWIDATAQHHHYLWQNTNLLLTQYRGAIGIKTGFTGAAGYCLLFEAARNGRALMGVVLDSTATNPATRFTVAARLLNWGFKAVLAGTTVAAQPRVGPLLRS